MTGGPASTSASTVARTPASTRSERLALAAMVMAVAGVVGAYLFYTISNSSYTFGCDYLTYDAAARRWLSGASPFDLSITVTGDCGVYQYPPSFLLAIAPFTLLPPVAASWAWLVLSVACLALAMAVIPVPPVVRIITFALAGTSWPMLFAIKVGAVGPLLLLVFALAWRWLDRPIGLAAAVAAGGLVKLQPALLVVWMALTGRWRALLATAVIAAVVGLVVLALDPRLWLDFLAVTRTLQGSAISVGANFAPASQALRVGASPEVAALVGTAHTVAVLGVVVLAARRSSAEASLLVTAVASQVVAPVMWDHYATVVFLPMAWLLARGIRPALVIGVVLNAMLVAVVPPIAYVVVLDATIVAVWLVGRRRTSDAGDEAGAGAGADAGTTAGPYEAIVAQ